MGRTHLVIPDPHAHPEYNNDRFDWLAGLINDIKPDVVVNLGDHFDMPSLSGYDKGTKGFEGRRYIHDLNAGLEAHERMWNPVKKTKKRLPYRVVLEGNHEQRVKRVVNSTPELDGAISFSQYEFEKYYDEVVEYQGQTPGIIDIDGVMYAHYFVSGVMGRAIGGEHPAYSLLTKEFVSCTCGHIHTADYAMRTTVDGRKINGLVAGVYQDYHSEWAGEVNKLWWRGVVVKRNVELGCYDPQFISMEQLRREYGRS